MKTATLPLISDAPEGYTDAQLNAITAEDDYNRLVAAESLVVLLTRHRDREVARLTPAGIVEVHHIGSKFAGDEPDPVPYLIEQLQRWTLTTNYAHYSRCADGLTMFCGNFDEYSAGFHVDVTTGSEADALLTRLMHENKGWSGGRNGRRL